MRELDDSTKGKTWLDMGVGTKINRGAVDIFGKKGSPHFSRNGNFPLVERQQKCHYLDDSRSLLRPGTFCSLQQLPSLIHDVIRNGAVVFL